MRRIGSRAVLCAFSTKSSGVPAGYVRGTSSTPPPGLGPLSTPTATTNIRPPVWVAGGLSLQPSDSSLMHKPLEGSLLQAFVSLNLSRSRIEEMLRTVEGRKIVEAAKISVSRFGVPRPKATVEDRISDISLLLEAESSNVVCPAQFEPIIDFLVKRVAAEQLPVKLTTHFAQLPDFASPHGWELLRNKMVVTNGLRPKSLPEGTIVLARSDGTTTPLSTRCVVGDFSYYTDSAFFQRVKVDSKDRLIIVSGESGSGKTWGMMGIARHYFQSELVFYFEVPSLTTVTVTASQCDEELRLLLHDNKLEAVYEGWKVKRDQKILNTLRSSILQLLRSYPAWPHAIAQDDDQVITIILDEIGGSATLLRSLCRIHRELADSLQVEFKVKRVEIICGGCGADAQVRPGSNPNTYHAVTTKPMETAQWNSWLKELVKDADKHPPSLVAVSRWLTEERSSKLVSRVKALLSNWRLAVHLILELCKLYDEQQESSLFLFSFATASRAVESCMSKAMDHYRQKNGLKDFTRVTATALSQKALAYDMLAVKAPLISKDDRKLIGTWGLLADHGGKLSSPEAELVTEEVQVNLLPVGVSRYVMSPALKTMTALAMGLKGEFDAFGEAFETEMMVFFVNLFQSAIILSLEGPVTVLLRTDWRAWKEGSSIVETPHHFQLDYGDRENSRLMALCEGDQQPKEGQKFSFDRIPILPDVEKLKQALLVTATSLEFVVGPPRRTGQRQTYIEHLTAFLEKPSGSARKNFFEKFRGVAVLVKNAQKREISVWKNVPRAGFADLIVVNNLTRELWLVQCKSMKTPSVDFDLELEKMGYGVKKSKLPRERVEDANAAKLFREALRIALGMETVRYFLCVNAPNPMPILQKIPGELRRGSKDPHVHILCNAFGFSFDSVDLSYIKENVQPEEISLDQSWLTVFKRRGYLPPTGK